MSGWARCWTIVIVGMLFSIALACGPQEKPAAPGEKAPETAPAAPPTEKAATPTPAPAAPAEGVSAWAKIPDAFQEALNRSETAQRAFDSANRFLSGWLDHIDPGTGLFPQYLHPIPAPAGGVTPEEMENIWTPMNNAADMFPFLGIAAFLTDRPTYDGKIKAILAAEKKLATTKNGLLTHYLLKEKRQYDLKHQELIFNTSEYIKDGLIPLFELTGDPTWLTRATGLMDAIFQAAHEGTDHGILPAVEAEVNGDVMQSLYRLAYATGDAKYVEYAQRLADAYFKIILPKNGGLPCHAWNFAQSQPYDGKLVLRDHGNEVVAGLALMYALLFDQNRQVADSYRPMFDKMLDRIAKEGRDPRGFFVSAIDTKTGKVTDDHLSDNWGYVLPAFYIHYLLHQDAASLETVKKLLSNLDAVSNYDWEPGVDGVADVLESAVYFYNRLPEPKTREWILGQFERLYKLQSHTGIADGTYLDGNLARSVMLVALMETQGASLSPWNREVRLGAITDKDALYLAVRAGDAYAGKIVFDRPRWKDFLKLPMNPPRVNEWPAWWTAEKDAQYRVEIRDEKGQPLLVENRPGADLIAGIPLPMGARETRFIKVEKLAEQPAPKAP